MKISTLLISMAALLVTTAQAGQQLYEPMSASVRAALSKAVSDTPVTQSSVLNDSTGQAWLAEMSRRLAKRLPDEDQRNDFLKTVYYEATRAGLDPELVLGLIEVESGFKKYAVSSVAARGYMQVMPFWTQTIGSPEHDLFHLRTNLRYGCNILRLYIDMEHGDLYRALGRYNGSLGKPEYPNMVLAAWKKHWDYTPGEQVGQHTTVQTVKVAGN
ncbi:lytic transglycosylase domain-containing protein [Sulfuriferula nivalis]|uniref:Transglycosylase n=1 Tax=Sulfuriferula nivalis TaxID=2675298 RepID=A0A809S3W7_9PROT|nr:lytic transglycosylase domain-containing protein [Sulfuriferula nivalis]BBP01538.1 transglycosylase [Sulfuriferula nivalis]